MSGSSCKRSKLVILSFFLLLIPSLSRAQPPGYTSWRPAPGYYPVQNPQQGYYWVEIDNCDEQVALYYGNDQVGVWVFDPPGYFPKLTVIDPWGRRATEWGSQRNPPIEPPAPTDSDVGRRPHRPHRPRPRPHSEASDWQTHGVIREGIEASAEAAASDTPQIPDYTKLPSITVVSSDVSKREKVLSDLNTSPYLASFKSQFGPRARGYAPGHAHLAPFQLERDTQFQASQFVILVQGVQDSAGKARPVALYSYDGPEQLAGVLRNVDANYDPNAVAAPLFAGSIGFATVLGPAIGVTGAGLLGLAHWTRKRKAAAV